jgi:hypothetical protein
MISPMLTLRAILFLVLSTFTHAHDGKQVREFLNFQAQERKVFYDDLSAEKTRLDTEWDIKGKELLAAQRQARRDFEPENHSLQERREFFVSQREEMMKFKHERKAAHDALKAEQSKRRSEFHHRQSHERKAMRNGALPVPQASPSA